MFKTHFHDFFYVIVSQGIEDDLSLTSGFYEIRKLESLELMGNSGFGDAEKNSEIADAHFVLLESVKDFNSGGVTEKLEKHGKLSIIAVRTHFSAGVVEYILVDNFTVAGEVFFAHVSTSVQVVEQLFN